MVWPRGRIRPPPAWVHQVALKHSQAVVYVLTTTSGFQPQQQNYVSVAGTMAQKAENTDPLAPRSRPPEKLRQLDRTGCGEVYHEGLAHAHVIMKAEQPQPPLSAHELGAQGGRCVVQTQGPKKRGACGGSPGPEAPEPGTAVSRGRPSCADSRVTLLPRPGEHPAFLTSPTHVPTPPRSSSHRGQCFPLSHPTRLQASTLHCCGPIPSPENHALYLLAPAFFLIRYF